MSKRLVTFLVALLVLAALCFRESVTGPLHDKAEGVTVILTIHGEPVDTVRVWNYRGVQIVR